MNKIGILVLAGLLMAVAPAAYASEGMKLGFVDLQKVLNLSEAGKEAKEQIAGMVKKFQEDLNGKQEELKKLKAELEKQSVMLAEPVRAAKEKDYQQKLKDFQRLNKDAQDELQGKDEELTRKILEEVEKIVQDYGKKNGLSFIFVRNESMIFADAKADLTDEILNALNASRKKK